MNSEEMMRAANRNAAAANDMCQAAANLEGHVHRMEMVLQKFIEDFTAIVERMEALGRKAGE